MKFSVAKPPTKKLFLLNLEEKMKDSDFLGDIKALIRPDEIYDSNKAWEVIRKELIEKL
jgi:hypothetical protein